jgi:hypothetical protein
LERFKGNQDFNFGIGSSGSEQSYFKSTGYRYIRHTGLELSRCNGWRFAFDGVIVCCCQYGQNSGILSASCCTLATDEWLNINVRPAASGQVNAQRVD